MRIPWFRNKKKTPLGESAPQLTLWDRRAAESPSSPNHSVPYSVYDEMETDSMVQTALTVKKLGVLAAPYLVEPSGDRERDAFVEEAFERMEGSPATLLQATMDAFCKGWSVQEMVFEQDGGRIWLESVRPKDPSLFGLVVDTFGRIEGLSLQVPGEQERRLPIGKFVVYRHRSSYRRPKGRSDLDAAYPHWQAKARISLNWRVFLSKYATPSLVAKCGANLPAHEREALLRGLQALDSTTAMAMPSDVEIEQIGGSRDSSNSFIDAIDFHNREIARAVLGQTLTTDEGRRVGSLAMGKVHLQVLTLQLEALRTELADAVMTEQVIRPLVEMNFGPGPVPRFRFERATPKAFVSGEI